MLRTAWTGEGARPHTQSQGPRTRVSAPHKLMTYDIAVIGGGIVGLSFAMQATEKFPRLRVVVLEKEAGVARHQTGHNSGVIHSGVYYKAGSLKARLCVAGAREMVEFCSRHGVPHKVCGKLIVATNSEEAARLDELLARGVANGLEGLRLLGREAMLEIEPHAGGVRALYVPSTGITDFAAVAAKYAEIAVGRGAEVKTSAGVVGFDRSSGVKSGIKSGAKSSAAGDAVVIRTRAGDFSARYVVNCAGLYSDRVARMAGDDPGMMIVPFRGEYYDLAAARGELVRGLIYPVPDPRYPFLGVHFTRRIHGNVDAGPNAVLAFRREGYRWRDFDLGEALEVAAGCGISGDGAAGVEKWAGGVSAVAAEARVCAVLPAVGAGGADGRYDAGWVRGAGAGGGGGWRAGGRFQVCGARAVFACAECAVSRGDGIVADRAGDLEDGAGGDCGTLMH